MCANSRADTQKIQKRGKQQIIMSWLMSHGSWLMSHVHVSCGICDISHVMCHISRRPTDESVKIYSKQITRLCPTSGPTNPPPLKTCWKVRQSQDFTTTFYLLQQRCRTTWSCIIGPYHQRRRRVSTVKDSQSTRRADRSHQQQSRLHTVGFCLAEGQPTRGVCQRPSLRALYPIHES